jgi:NADPH:quinone reductase-like Zn-dependent oxidoreductase
MKAFIVDKYGKDSRLRAGQLPEPAIGDHDVLVRILASGVNPLDAKIMAGEFKLILPSRDLSSWGGGTRTSVWSPSGLTEAADCRRRAPQP